MPHLTDDQATANRRRIEDAALRLFTSRGFHGVGLRKIATEAGVSLGNVYNYFGSKEDIFQALITRLYRDFTADGEPLAQFLRATRFPDDLEELGHAVGAMVEAHADYLKLVYVDIAEFDGAHARPHYAGLAERFGLLLKDRLRDLKARAVVPADVDPAAAFTAVYMLFANYFIIERLIGAKGHLGLADPAAIRLLARLVGKGLGAP